LKVNIMRCSFVNDFNSFIFIFLNLNLIENYFLSFFFLISPATFFSFIHHLANSYRLTSATHCPTIMH